MESSTLYIQNVTYTSDGLDKLGVARVFLNRISQPTDMYVEGARVASVTRFPYFLKQWCSFDDNTLLFHQYF
jgi:hypothetical protein